MFYEFAKKKTNLADSIHNSNSEKKEISRHTVTF
jgi:hypothetical protein